MLEPAPQRSDSRALWPTPPHAVTPASAETSLTTERPARRRSFIGDVSAGLFLGDFARDLGLPGAVTQVAISFIPLIGSICAVRDLTADLRRRDHLGAALNALALAPIVGGFSKTFEVMRSAAHVGHAVRVSHEQAQRHNHLGEPLALVEGRFPHSRDGNGSNL